MNDAGYRRWAGTEWWSESYERLWQESKDTAPEAAMGAGDSSGSADGVVAKEEAQGARAVAPQESVVYLTADSPEELEELKEGETYIIGGICDHNRYKVRPTRVHTLIIYHYVLTPPMMNNFDILLHGIAPVLIRSLRRSYA